MTPRKSITIYTDGACIGNPGPGGYGAVLLFANARKELSGGYRLTTNNRMETLAAIKGLSALTEPCDVTLFSDSSYVVNGMEKGWAKRWKANGWMRNKGEPASNPDRWEALLALCDRHHVTFRWVRGHNGDKENERCDVLATMAAREDATNVDEAYEAGPRL